MTKEELAQKKNEFVVHLFFQAAWNAATQHNSVWNEKTKDADKITFKRSVKKELTTMLEQYKNPVTKEQHMKNIKKLQTLRGNNGEYLDTGKSQKILNVMCKFYWCNGWILTPPHLTIDSQILSKLPDKTFKELGLNKETAKWTKFDDETYEKLIDAFYDVTGNEFPAEWELENWKNTIE